MNYEFWVMDLEFSNVGGVWRTSYTSEGDTVVQLSRSGGGWLNVYAGIEGMEMPCVASWGHYEAGAEFIFMAALPAGLSVAIASETAVVAAKAQATGG